MSGMTDKSIKKRIIDKVESIAKTITDLDVRQALYENLILTGGSITSMIMGEKVNDFDFYFKTEEAMKKVAQYYIDKYIEKHPSDKGYINLKFDENFNCYRIKIDSVGIAYDEDPMYEPLTPEDELDGKSYEEQETDTPYEPVFITSNAISLSNGVQIIIRFTGDVDEIHENFDFIHATCSYDYHTGKLNTPVEALRSMQSKRLYYRGSKYPICSLFRIRKFMDRGWRISAAQIAKIAFQISELDLSDPITLEDQLIGVDYSYMQMFIDALKNVDADKLNATYLGSIIDRIFGEEL